MRTQEITANILGWMGIAFVVIMLVAIGMVG